MAGHIQTEQATSERPRREGFALALNLAVTENDSLEPVLRGCCAAIVEHLNIPCVAVWAYDDRLGMLELEANAGTPGKQGLPRRMPVAQGPLGLVVSERKTCRVRHLAADPRFGCVDWCQKMGATEFAGYPLIVGQRLLGVLGLFSTCPFCEVSLEALSAAAGTMALGIERFRVEETLLRSEKRLRSILDTVLNGMFTIDERGNVESLNLAAQRMFGYRAAEAVGQPAALLVPALEVSAQDGALVLGEENIAGAVHEIWGRRRDGTSFPLELAVNEVHTAGQHFFHVAARDLTELNAARERALQAERLAAIGQMVAGLAHESRNALQRCQASLEMLTLEMHGRQALAHVSEIQAALNDLNRLYEEVRGYAAPIHLRRQRCDLGEVLEEALDQLTALRKGRRVRFRQKQDAADLIASVDRFRLMQVLRNVLANVLDACADPVEIDASWKEVNSAGRPALRLSIRDNGPGLSPEQELRIFEPFYTTKTHGTGLGMAIAKRIVEAHGGQIAAAPRSGRGAEIIITLMREVP
jgi:PAS domain S-box-containing protein